MILEVTPSQYNEIRKLSDKCSSPTYPTALAENDYPVLYDAFDGQAFEAGLREIVGNLAVDLIKGKDVQVVVIYNEKNQIPNSRLN